MAGTRTAPLVGLGTETNVGITLHMIDAAGDVTTEYVAPSVTSALTDVEAFADAYQLNTQTSVYKVSLISEWEGVADPQNATALYRGQVSDGINALFRDTALQRTFTGRVFAPIAAIMQGNQDIPLLTAPLPALVTQYLTLLGAGYDLDALQFTTRRERRNNPRIRI